MCWAVRWNLEIGKYDFIFAMNSLIRAMHHCNRNLQNMMGISRIWKTHVWFSCQSSGILSPTPDIIRKYAHNERNIMDLGCILLNPIFCLVLDIQFPKTSKTDHWIYRLEIWIWKLWYWKLDLSLLSLLICVLMNLFLD